VVKHYLFITTNLSAHGMLGFADDLDIHLLPKVGAAWMPQGTQAEVMTPGKNEKSYLAGALHLATGKLSYGLGPRKNNGLFRELLTLLDTTYPARQMTRIYVVVDNYCIHKAKAVDQWLASPPVLRCFGCRPTVQGPTPLSGRVAMCTTSVPGTTHENASMNW
jgi:hypothetical protein